ncbi:hypothetical protein ACB092_01G170300 [Castanea dentata]
MYNHLKHTLQIVEELHRVTLENAHEVSETSTLVRGCSERGGGCRGRGRCRGCQAGCVRMPKQEHVNEDEDEFVIEELKDKGACDTYVNGAKKPRCMFGTDARPSHSVGHEDTLPSQCTFVDDSEEHTSHTYVGPRSSLPTQLSPPLFTGSAHVGGCIFVPTPSRPTPPLIHANPT